ncbi:MAG: hypothetical protein N3G80_03225 [Candidatus Micrarchaeota archaeon]|nr:hypothetical protein [Candidatus Micrarchaeota archaeon]
MHKLASEVEKTIRKAAGDSKVVFIKLAIGGKVTLSKIELAAFLHKRFPSASIEIEDCKLEDSVIVREIEVE